MDLRRHDPRARLGLRDRGARQGADEPRPEPTPNLIGEVKEYLDRRRDLTASLTVVGPRYLPVKVTARAQHLEAGDQRRRRPDPGGGRHRDNGSTPTCTPPGAGRTERAGRPASPCSPPTCSARSCRRRTSPISDHCSCRPTYPPITSLRSKPTAPKNWDAAKERPFELTDKAASVRVADYETVCAAQTPRHHAPPNRLKDVPWPTPAAICATCHQCCGSRRARQDEPTAATGFGLGTFLLAFEKILTGARRRRSRTPRERAARTHPRLDRGHDRPHTGAFRSLAHSAGVPALACVLGGIGVPHTSGQAAVGRIPTTQGDVRDRTDPPAARAQRRVEPVT